MPLTTLFSIKNRFSKVLLISLPIIGLSIALPVGAAELQPQPVLKKAEHTPQWAEQYIHQHNSYLLDNSQADHVLAFYYFGSYQGFTIFGMERVKGDDYESHNTVLVFKDSVLKGYYQELTVFPAGVSAEGVVFFPPNHAAVDNIDLANGIYPVIQFKPEIERYKKGYLKRLPSESMFVPNAQLDAADDKLEP